LEFNSTGFVIPSNFVILSEAKDLLSPALAGKQIVRVAQDDSSIS